MEQDYLDYSVIWMLMLQFIQYKCWCSGCTVNVYTDSVLVNLMDMERYQALRILCDSTSRMSEQQYRGRFCLPLCSKIPIAQRMGRDNEYKGEKYLL